MPVLQNTTANGNNFLQSLFSGNILQIVVSAVLCYFCIMLLGQVLLHSKKREWDSFYYKWMCLAATLWAGLTFAYYLSGDVPLVQQLYSLRYIFLVFMPGLLCLHVWKQVSYKEITWWVVLLCLIVPVVYTGFIVQATFWPTPGQSVEALATGWSFNVFLLYVGAIFIKCYLLLFNVFYQMPAHMRKSAYYMLAGITIIPILNLAQFMLGFTFPYDLNLVAACLLLLLLFYAFSAASSANVIVTSRDFVFGNLSTMVLVLNRKMRILDWNKKSDDNALYLPTPIYREPFQQYRKRILDEGDGRVSSHDNNIISTTHGDVETHYLITTHEVRQKKRQFGYLVEISEVTKIYTVFRYLEEIATIDQLTGLYNRNAYLNEVRTLVADEWMPLLVIVGDVNNLKPINDTFGHLVGDSLLMTVASIIADCAPHGAFAARIGGDEFVLLLSRGSIAAATAFIALMEERLNAIDDEKYHTPTISWGYALMESTQQRYNDVFAEADRMMYNIKKSHFRFRSGGLLPNGESGKTGAAAPESSENAGKPSAPAAPAQPVSQAAVAPDAPARPAAQPQASAHSAASANMAAEPLSAPLPQSEASTVTTAADAPPSEQKQPAAARAAVLVPAPADAPETAGAPIQSAPPIATGEAEAVAPSGGAPAAFAPVSSGPQQAAAPAKPVQPRQKMKGLFKTKPAPAKANTPLPPTSSQTTGVPPSPALQPTAAVPSTGAAQPVGTSQSAEAAPTAAAAPSASTSQPAESPKTPGGTQPAGAAPSAGASQPVGAAQLIQDLLADIEASKARPVVSRPLPAEPPAAPPPGATQPSAEPLAGAASESTLPPDEDLLEYVDHILRQSNNGSR